MLDFPMTILLTALQKAELDSYIGGTRDIAALSDDVYKLAMTYFQE